MFIMLAPILSSAANLIGGHLVVGFESVEHGKAIIVDDGRNFSRLAQNVGVIKNFLALDRHQHDVGSLPRGRWPQRLIAQLTSVISKGICCCAS